MTILVVTFILFIFVVSGIILHNMVDISPEDDSLVTNIIETTSTELSTTVETLTSSTTTSVKTDTETNLVEELTTSNVSTDATTTEDTIISIINPQIIVIPDETTAKSTKATTIATTTKIETTPISTTNQVVIGNEDVRTGANFVKTFTRGTYYPGWEAYGTTQVYGGSGRLLMDCSIKDDEIKGSVSCKYIYDRYKYNYNGARTLVYLDIPEVPGMSGFYFVDDCCLRDDTIDFYFTYEANCPFITQGVLTKISCYIVPKGSVS
jgi:hypothetical protein